MGFTKKQISYAQQIRRRVLALREDDDLWRLLLRNAGCKVDEKRGVPSLSHPRNSQDAFECLMYYLSAYPETRLDGDHWASKIDAARRRMMHNIEAFAGACISTGLMDSTASLESFIERMTRDPENGEDHGTRDLDECTLPSLIKITEGLKAWMRREAHKRGVVCPSFGAARHQSDRRSA